MSSESERPHHEISAPPVYAAIWRKRMTSSGRRFFDFDVRIQKRYKDERSGEWKTTSFFRPQDLPKLALVASRCFEYLSLRESDRRGGSRCSEAEPPAPDQTSPHSGEHQDDRR